MKHLQDYIDEAQSKAFDDNGAFFAFGKKQFNEAKKDGVKYSDIGYGLICPTNNVEKLMDELEKISENGIKQDIKENGIKNIIHRELANHEAQITRNIDDTVDALIDYNITREQIADEYKEYLKLCVKNDWF